MSGVLAAVGVSTVGRQLHGLRERPVAHLVRGTDFYQVDSPRFQLFQESHCMGPCRGKQD